MFSIGLSNIFCTGHFKLIRQVAHLFSFFCWTLLTLGVGYLTNTNTIFDFAASFFNFDLVFPLVFYFDVDYVGVG